MYTIAIVGQKGGTGKTTLAIGLSVAAARDDQSAVIIDIDQQANAANWKDRRDVANPAVVSAQQSRLKQTLQAAENHGADFVVIDTPGKSDSAAIEAARVADLVLVPLFPQIFHLETLPGTRDLLRVAGDPSAFVVLNMLHPQATRQADEAKKMVADTFSFPVCPVHLSRLDIYPLTQMTGSAPNEQEPEGKAALEMKQLYQFINQERSHGNRKVEAVENGWSATGA